MHYAFCPKCGHKPLPENQALPAACPACGLVLAKFGMAPMRAATVERVEPEESWLAAIVFFVPGQVSRTNWIARLATFAVFVAWTLWIWHDADVRAGESGSNSLHMILLPFHEAGHVIFRLGEFITILGGTLGQLLMPIILGGALLIKRRDPFGAALFAWLLGYSVVDMAVYMYDAFDPKLQLLGGGTGADRDSHDWQNIFGDTGLLRRAQGIGLFFGWVGKAMMLAALAWAARILWLQRERMSDALFAEEDAEIGTR